MESCGEKTCRRRSQRRLRFPHQRKQAPPWLYGLCVAFMGRDQWLKAWAGSREPLSWAGILIKLGLLGLTKSLAPVSAFQALSS